MIAARAAFPLAAGADHVAGAVLVGAKEGTAALHAFLLVGSAGSNGGSGPCGLRATRPLAASCVVSADTSRCPIPRHCRRHRRVRSHSAETAHRRDPAKPSSPASCLHGKLALVMFAIHLPPAELVAPGIELAGLGRPARRTPTPLRWAAACRPTSRRPPHLHKRCERRDISRPSRSLCWPSG